MSCINKQSDYYKTCKKASESVCPVCKNGVITKSLTFHGIGTIVKVLVGVITGSQVLIAEAVHSFTDTVSYGVNYFGTKTQKISFANQSSFIGAFMLITGVWVCADNWAILITGTPAHPGLLAPVIAGAAVLLNIHLNKLSICASDVFPDDEYVYLCGVQNQVNLKAAIAGFAGIMLAEFGLFFCDPLFAMGIGFFQLWGAVEIFTHNNDKHTTRQRHNKNKVVVAASVIGLCIIIFFGFNVSDDLSKRSRILIPSTGMLAASSRVDALLGRARYFAIIDTDKKTTNVISNSSWDINGDVSFNLVNIVRNNRVGTVFAYKIGDEMFTDLSKENVKMYYVDIKGTTVGQSFDDYQYGKLKVARAANVHKGFGRGRIRWFSPW